MQLKRMDRKIAAMVERRIIKGKKNKARMIPAAERIVNARERPSMATLVSQSLENSHFADLIARSFSILSGMNKPHVIDEFRCEQTSLIHNLFKDAYAIICSSKVTLK